MVCSLVAAFGGLLVVFMLVSPDRIELMLRSIYQVRIQTKLEYITSTWYTCPAKLTNFEVLSEVPT